MDNAQWGVVVVAVAALISAVAAYIQTLVQQRQVANNTAATAKHEVQLNGQMDKRIQSAVNAGPEQPSQQQRDMPQALSVNERNLPT